MKVIISKKKYDQMLKELTDMQAKIDLQQKMINDYQAREVNRLTGVVPKKYEPTLAEQEDLKNF